MKAIKKSDVKALLNNYHDNIKKHENKSRFRPKTEYTPDIITALSALDLSGTDTSEELTSHQTHQLALALLTRNIRFNSSDETKYSERLAKALEEKLSIDKDTLNEVNAFQQSNAVVALVQPTESITGKMALGQASRHYRGLFFKQTEPYFEQLRKLLSHGALGELGQATDIWTNHPALLDCYGTIYHPNRIRIDNKPDYNIEFHANPGRYKHINCTYLQLLWANGEFEAAKPIEGLLGAEETARQFFELFPDGVIKKDNFNLEHAKTLLANLFEALAKDDTLVEGDFDIMNDETRQALYAVHDYAKPTSEHKTGLVFDADFYFAARMMFDRDQGYSEVNPRLDGPECNFWKIRVEEWLKGCLGTFYLRRIAQGISRQKSPTNGCLLQDGSSYFAFRQKNPNTIFGLNAFVGDSDHTYQIRLLGGGGHGFFKGGEYFKTLYLEQKNLGDDLCRRATEARKNYPGI